MSAKLSLYCSAVLGRVGFTLAILLNLIFCNARNVIICPLYNAYARPVELVPLLPAELKFNLRIFCPPSVTTVCSTLLTSYRVMLPPDME